MTAIEGNKLIAEFMECEEKGYYRWIRMPYPQAGKWVNERHLEYHTSWDWLMPVVEKIESLAAFNVIIFKRCCDVQDDNSVGDHIIEVTAAPSKIEAVYDAVLQFIQWYNQNKV
jgi:hypothetical protein